MDSPEPNAASREAVLKLSRQMEALEQRLRKVEKHLEGNPSVDPAEKDGLLAQAAETRQMVLELKRQQEQLQTEGAGSPLPTDDPFDAGSINREALDRRVEQARQQMLELRRQQNELERARDELENLRRGVNEFAQDKSATIRQLSQMLARIERMRGQPGGDPSAAKKAAQFRPVLQNHIGQLEGMDETVWNSEEIPAQLPQARAKLEAAQASLTEVKAILPAQSRWERLVDFIR